MSEENDSPSQRRKRPGIVSSASRVIIPSVPKWQGIDLKALLSAQLPNYWLLKICNNAAAVAFSLCESFKEADQQSGKRNLMNRPVPPAGLRQKENLCIYVLV